MRGFPSSPSTSGPLTSFPPSPPLSSRRSFPYLPSSVNPLLTTTLVLVLLPLLLITTLLLLHDPHHSDFSPSYWSSSSSSSSSPPSPISPSHALESNGGGGVAAIGGGSNSSSITIPAPPVSAPAPAPAMEPTSLPNSIVENIDPKLGRIELDLARARDAIRRSVQEANRTSSISDPDYVPTGPAYWNPHAFHRSYLEMEKLFRVYVYEEGEPPLFHDGPCRSIYSMEGRFIYNMETETRLRTRDPEKAHVHFLPFSVTKMVKYEFDSKDHKITSITSTVQDYIGLISRRYPYWNRSLGADHFMLSCHDWGPRASAAVPNLFFNSIRVLCNANTSEGFNPIKDVSLPEMNLKTGFLTGIIGGPEVWQRPILAFFAGGVHGPIRPALLKHWKGKDKDVQVYEYLPRGIEYYDMMKKSKFCICPSGYEVASPRVVEAMYLECVPVIISDHYVLPFSDVLNWKTFSVQVAVEDIPDLKNILMRITPKQYIRMQKRVRQVQRHFVVNSPPKRYDVFHMILHSTWLRRMNVRIHPQGRSLG